MEDITKTNFYDSTMVEMIFKLMKKNRLVCILLLVFMLPLIMFANTFNLYIENATTFPNQSNVICPMTGSVVDIESKPVLKEGILFRVKSDKERLLIPKIEEVRSAVLLAKKNSVQHDIHIEDLSQKMNLLEDVRKISTVSAENDGYFKAIHEGSLRCQKDAVIGVLFLSASTIETKLNGLNEYPDKLYAKYYSYANGRKSNIVMTHNLKKGKGSYAGDIIMELPIQSVGKVVLLD